MLGKFKKASQKFSETMSVAGMFPNAFVQFLSVAFGNNTGKLLSICTIIFGFYIMWIGFFGQIETVEHLILKDEPTAEELAIVRETYKEAISSVAVPLGILIGAVPTIIGIGLMSKRKRKKDAEKTEEDLEEVEYEVPPVNYS